MANEFIARKGLIVSGSTRITGSLDVNAGITGSLLGTASSATSASYAYTSSVGLIAKAVDIVSGSIGSAQTSYTGSFSGSFVGSITSASYAVTASYALNGGGGGTGAGFPYSGSAVITGSLYVSGSGITGSLFGTASYAETASVAKAVEVSSGSTNPSATQYTGSFTGSLTGTLIGTGSWANYAVTASYVSGAASTWDSITNKPAGILSSSTQINALTGVSASFATTASAATSITFVPTTASFATTSSAATSITFTPSSASFATTSSAATSITFVPDTSVTSSFPFDVTGSLTNPTFYTKLSTNPRFNSTGSLYIGASAGLNASGSYHSTFVGNFAGSNAPNAYYSMFIGQYAGQNATNANTSIFLGRYAGSGATGASNAIFIGGEAGDTATSAVGTIGIGTRAGNSGSSASYSTFLGYQAGIRNNGRGSLGSYNIVIGTNISLPDNRTRSVNIGGIIFATGSYATISGDAYTSSVAGAKVGIGIVDPVTTLHVFGDVSASGYTGSLFGTASWAQNATSASYALTSSFASLANAVDYTNITSKPTLVSASSQIDVRSTTGIETIATTGSNTFTGIQTISNTTNATNFTNGALIVDGGVSIKKDLYVQEDITIGGTLYAVSQSILLITSSIIDVQSNRIITNLVSPQRFGGLSVNESGSVNSSGSLFWDSIQNRWIYQNAPGEPYSSSILIAGPKHVGALGDEPGLTAGRIPVASGDDHIDTRAASSSMRVDFPSRLTHIEAGLQVTGSISSSVGFNGNGAGITGVISSSFATTASAATSITFVPTTASFATTASAATSITFVPSSASFATTSSAATSITFTPSSASFATTSSAATSITFTPSSASFATTASFARSASAATSITFVPTTASYAATASNLNGGTANYIPLWTSATAQSSSTIYQSAGNVGIGTTSPGVPLHVQGAISGSTLVLAAGTQTFNNTDSIFNSTNFTVNSSNIIVGNDTADAVNIGNNTLYVNNSNVGIGTTSPGASLHVQGNVSASSYTSSISNGIGYFGTASYAQTAATASLLLGSVTSASFATTAATASSFSGSLQIVGVAEFPAGINLTGSLNFSAGGVTGSVFGTSSWASNVISASFATSASWAPGGSGLSGGTANYIPLWTSATAQSSSNIYQSAGNVGIGTQSPSTRLHVDGQIFASASNATIRVERTAHAAGANDFSIEVYAPQGTALGETSIRFHQSNRYYHQIRTRGSGFRFTQGADDNLVDIAAMGIYASGSVGIGTTSPNRSLSVNGSANITGSLDVTGAFTAQTKSFKIRHQTQPGKYLVYGVLEGNEHAVYARGRLQKSTIITLPEEWEWLVDMTSITVQLTPIGTHQKLYVDGVYGTRIVIGNDNMFGKDIDCYYTVMATRKDVAPLRTVE